MFIGEEINSNIISQYGRPSQLRVCQVCGVYNGLCRRKGPASSDDGPVRLQWSEGVDGASHPA